MGSPEQLPRRKMTSAHKAGRQEAFSGGNEHKIQHQFQKKVKMSVRTKEKKDASWGVRVNRQTDVQTNSTLLDFCLIYVRPYLFLHIFSLQESILKSSSSCSLGSYLSMVDPWYNSNIRSLGYMIPGMVGKPHSGAKPHKETEPGL